MVRKKNKIELKLFIERVVGKIQANFDLDEVILFGSYAKGEERDESDIDIALVSSELSKGMYSNIKRVKQESQLIEPGLQLLAFNSATYYDEDYAFPSLIKEIKETGKKVYSKGIGLDLTSI